MKIRLPGGQDQEAAVLAPIAEEETGLGQNLLLQRRRRSPILGLATVPDPVVPTSPATSQRTGPGRGPSPKGSLSRGRGA